MESEEAFRRFRQLAIGQQLSTVCGYKPATQREGLRRVIAGGRRTIDVFAAAELRLLLALGHQIGMARRRIAT